MFRPHALDFFGRLKPVFRIIAFAGALAAVPAARADIRLPATRQPSAQDQTVRLTLGDQVDIVLSGYSGAHGGLDFLLRSNPAHGTLSTPRPTGRDTAVVTYSHRAADGPGVDAFTFAVRAQGSAVSAAATVRLQIVDPPPRVIVLTDPSEMRSAAGANRPPVEFGAVKVGEEGHREVTLENAGGGVAFGAVEPTAPWSAVAADDADLTNNAAPVYRLGRGERQKFVLIFRPGVARRFEGELPLGAGSGTLRLVGTGLPSANVATSPAPTPPAEIIIAPTPTPALAVRTPSPTSSPQPSPSRASQTPSPAASSSVTPSPTPTPALAVSTAESDVGEDTVGDSPILGLWLAGADRHTLTLSWNYPATPPTVAGPWPTHYRAELQKVRPGADEMIVEWQRHTEVLWSSQGGNGGPQ
ncbi:MAG: hypothetical protein JO117_01045, partial [Verrucomicrobia bacterium]|nr:hypothetical protein [Verrucomicrobiota bacterium]